MRSQRVDTISKYLSPSSEHWARVAPVRVAMMPTPLAMQPTAYVRNSWADRKYGETASLDVASVHDGATWALRASWTGSPAGGGADFPDAIAVALPVRSDSALAVMGTPEAPVHYLRWNAREKGARSVLASGIGTSRPGPEVRQAAEAATDGTTWHVVLARALGVGTGVAPLEAGKRTGVGFAVWRGANDERAGIKAFTIDWTELDLDA